MSDAAHASSAGKPLLSNNMTVQSDGNVTVEHGFLTHEIDPNTETVIIGTFNPGHICNVSFFYSSPKNYLWRLLPEAFAEEDLRGAGTNQKMEFCKRRRVDFIDLIAEVEVEKGKECGRSDTYLDGRVTKWRPVITELEPLQSLRRACFTRSTFGDVKNIECRVKQIDTWCRDHKIDFACLITPSMAYRSIPYKERQAPWTKFFSDTVQK